MARIKLPAMSYKEIGEKGANYALDEFEYNGLTIRQWADKITSGDYAPVVHGKWLNFYNDYSCAECDRCGTTFEVTDNESDEGLWNEFKRSYNYCPNCGAKMDKEVNYDD